MYVCNDCGMFFEEDMLRINRESVGEFWGAPAYQEYGVCPYCKSTSYSEAEQCEECGEYCNSLELEYSMENESEVCMCSECANENRKSLENRIIDLKSKARRAIVKKEKSEAKRIKEEINRLGDVYELYISRKKMKSA